MTNYEWFIFAAMLAGMWFAARSVRKNRERVEASNAKCIESNVAMTSEHRTLLVAVEKNTRVGEEMLELQRAIGTSRNTFVSRGGSA